MSSTPDFNPEYRPELDRHRHIPHGDAPPECAPTIVATTVATKATSFDDNNIPMATDVVVTDQHEPVREDKERFWNNPNDDNGPEPKNGIGIMQGWRKEISPFYTLYYFITVCCVTVALISLTGAFPLGDWIWIVQHMALVLYITFVVPRTLCCCGPCADRTYLYLRHRIDANQAQSLLDEYHTGVPTLFFRVRCYHTETETYFDSEGDRQTRTRTVTTYDGKEVIPIRSCEDQTANFDRVNLREYKLTKVKLTKSFVADKNLQVLRTRAYEKNRHRDRHCRVSEWMKMEIPNFKPYILSCVDNNVGSNKMALHPATYALAHVLLFPALPLRVWLCSMTGKVKLDIRKKIEIVV